MSGAEEAQIRVGCYHLPWGLALSLRLPALAFLCWNYPLVCVLRLRADTRTEGLRSSGAKCRARHPFGACCSGMNRPRRLGTGVWGLVFSYTHLTSDLPSGPRQIPLLSLSVCHRSPGALLSLTAHDSLGNTRHNQIHSGRTRAQLAVVQLRVFLLQDERLSETNG